MFLSDGEHEGAGTKKTVSPTLYLEVIFVLLLEIFKLEKPYRDVCSRTSGTKVKIGRLLSPYKAPFLKKSSQIFFGLYFSSMVTGEKLLIRRKCQGIIVCQNPELKLQFTNKVDFKGKLKIYK